MELKCSSKELSNALNAVLPIAQMSSSATSGLTGDIAIIADSETETLSIKALGIDASIEKNIHAEIEKSGTTKVNCKMFADYIKKITDTPYVALSTECGYLHIKFDKNRTKIIETATQIANLELEIANGTFVGSLTAKDLKKLVSDTTYCSLPNDTRLLVKSCNLVSTTGKIETICLDGFRLAHSECVCDNVVGNMDILVLVKTLASIATAFGDDEIISITYNDKFISFVSKTTKILMTRADGEPFALNKFIRQVSTNHIFSIDKKAIKSSIDRLTIICNSSTAQNLVKLEFGAMGVKITATAEKADTVEYIPCECIDGTPDIEIKLNARYLLDAISHIDNDNIVMILTDSRTGVVISSDKYYTDKTWGLILPLR